MRHFLTWAPTLLLIAGILVACSSQVENPVEARLTTLADQAEAQTADGDFAGTLESLAAMARIDGQHPKLHLRLVMLQRRRDALDQVGAVGDQLSLPDGPGRLYAAALAAFFKGDGELAAKEMEQALHAYEALDHLGGRAASHTALGIMARVRKDFAVSKTEYEAARELQETLGDRRSLADILGNLASLERRAGNPEAAVERQREILTIRKELGDRVGQGRSWHEIGVGLRELEDLDGAIEAFGKAASLRRKLRDTGNAVVTLRELAATRESRGDLAGAVRDLARARELAGELKDLMPLANVCSRQGELELGRGKIESAIDSFGAAAASYHSAGAHGNEAVARSRIASTHAARGEYRRAREQLQPSLAEVDAFRGKTHEALLRTEFSLVLAAMGELTDALLEQERALVLYREAGDRRSEYEGLNHRGVIYHYLGDRERALRDVEAALRVAEEMNDPGALARGTNNLGILSFQAGQLDKSAELYALARERFARSEDEAGVASVQANVAELLAARGDFDRSAEELTQALDVFRGNGDRRSEASVLNQQGELELARGRADAAGEAHRQALEVAEAHAVPEEVWRANAGLAGAYARLGQRPTALAHAMQVLDGLEGARARLEIGAFKARFLANRMRHYERALELTGDEDHAASFRVAERARARALLDLLAESRSRLLDGVDASLRQREAQLLDEVGAATIGLASAESGRSAGAARRRLAQAREALEQHKVEVHRRAPRYGAMVYPQPVELARFRSRTLRPDEVLLQYFVGDEHAWLWVVSRDGTEQVALPHPGEIARLVRTFLDAIQSSPARLGTAHAEWEAGARLAEAVLPARLPAEGNRLLVAPDGPLHHVPFEALRRGGRFLVESHPVAVVPSGTALELMRDQTPASGEAFLGVADPKPVVGDWPTLPYARHEVEGIAELFASGERTVLLAERATKSALRDLDLDRFGYLHFATHGWMDGSDLRQTGLVLSARDGSGLLAVDEVLGLSLSARTVVLSACRSGLGELLRGEGLVGLTGAFLYAGADSVLVSLWNVEDRATSDLMLRFYRGLRETGDPVVALRQAKLELIASDSRSGRLVQRWAPFVLVGAPGRPAGE